MLLRTTVVSVLGASILTPGAAHAAPVAPGGPIAFAVLAHGGNGCPKGSLSTSTADDGAVLTAGFTKLRASVADRRTADCQLALEVTHPAGWTYGLRRARVEGIADVDQVGGGKITLQASHQGAGTASRLSSDVKNTIGAWRVTDEFPNVVYAECGAARALQLRVTLAASSGASGGEPTPVAYLAAGTATVSAADLVWKKCD
ncbi:hypothetical protein GCM10010124_04220 [Pilimelia terevasa]|uniref:DUF4360 domain-containing protein n=1 Tax=Pilimelia terevasa TaxID=53372 RepID=A0A8J3BMN7_9ACTN|nr:DUF4360 domain-containing protein [Pilimelia terevasa]GGK14776.1 hypothetical protein GCM10010124_04220 [Pilimelia terevasa]